MTEQETGQAAGVAEPETGPVTLREILASMRAVERAEEQADERRKRRDGVIRTALRNGLLSQAEMSRKTGLSEMQVSRIANGKTSGRTRSE